MIAQMMIANLDDRVIKIVVLVVVLVEYRHMGIWVHQIWLEVLLGGHGWVATGRFSKETWPLALLDFDST